ncbi:MAG: hypothetical protein B6A08_04270 [Sorangiineae bacterium NIC37A_2]|nr:MAG: hypothetical protein B6A08_04270 [Sorangiineae bacterium NIC37A_2]
MRMSDAPTPRLSKEQIEDLRRRRSEAADVLAQTLLDMWKAEQRAKRRGVPWPPPAEVPTAPPEVPRTRARRGPDKPLQRVFREYQRDDADTVKAILDTTWFPASELESEPEGGQRYRVVLNLGRTRAGVAILDAYGEVAVLRAIAVRLSHRRERHGSALGAFMIQIAHELGVARLYAAAATTGFPDALGFEPCERALLPAAARRCECAPWHRRSARRCAHLRARAIGACAPRILGAEGAEQAGGEEAAEEDVPQAGSGVRAGVPRDADRSEDRQACKNDWTIGGTEATGPRRRRRP